MSTRPTSDRRKRNAALLVVVLVLAALFPLRRVVGHLQRPFAEAGTWIAQSTFGFFDPASASSARVAALEAQRAALARDAVELLRLQEENADLRQRLSFVERGGARVVTAAVTGRSVGVHAYAFTIDRGTRDGVGVGMPVVVENGVLAGKVTAVTASTATVSALTDRGLPVAVSLLNGARTIGVAQGLDGTLLAVGYVPKEEMIRVNDLVVTSGLEDAVPSGLLVGVVNAVESRETEPFQRAIVEPLADVRRISSVTVILGRAADAHDPAL